MFATTAFAQEQKIFELNRTMKCTSVQHLTNYLTEQLKQKMIWAGQDENNFSYVALYENKETGSWTLIQYDSKTGCVLNSDSRGTPV